MYQKTIEKEEGYSKAQKEEIKKALEGLRVFRNSPKVMSYLKKRQAELKGKTDQ
ncbi:MAG TPA: hypothetical protein VJG83_03760 [archaeon]|nr:hypothetical protein [archaeon]